MARDLLSPVGILDETHGAVSRIAAPWLGVLWLAVLPYRFAQAYFIRELGALGREAPDHGDYVVHLAWIVLGFFLPAVLGRTVYVRACLLGLQSGDRVGREALRVPGAQLINSVYAALAFEVLFCLTVWTFIAIPLLAVPAGLVYAAVASLDRPGLIRPLGEVLRLTAGLKVVVGLLVTYSVALLIAYFNVFAALRAGLWAATALGGDAVARWEYLLRPTIFVPFFPAEPLTMLICLAVAQLIVEPFWLASLAVYVHRTRLRQSGEDLRLRFRMLTGGRG